MKKLLVLLLVFCLVGAVHAALGVDGTENFDTTADGAMPAGWGGWSAGVNYYGYFAGWQAWKWNAKGPYYPNVQGGAMVASPNMLYQYDTTHWAYTMQFHHNLSAAALPASVSGDFEMDVDVTAVNGNAYIKVEFYSYFHDGSNTDKAAALISEVLVGDPGTGAIHVQVPIPAGGVSITPVFSAESNGSLGIGTITYDNIVITAPEPMTIGLLGLGGLFLRRRK